MTADATSSSSPTRPPRQTFTGRRFQDAQYMAVRVEGGRVTGDEPIQRVAPDGEGIERWIMPGFCDLQVNGFAGRSFLEPELSPEDVSVVAEAVLRTGVTCFLPTVITNSVDNLCRQLGAIAEAIDVFPLVRAMCPGIHLEGPFLNPDEGPRGAHPREHVIDPDIAVFERLQAAARGRIVMLTVAPEQPGATDLIRAASAKGITVAIGHHRATREDVAAAVEAGARLVTHLGNGMDAMVPRHDNIIWMQLSEDRLWASFIADGHHLPPDALKAMLRAKTPLRSVLITDAVAPAGMPAGLYRFSGQDSELRADGRVVMPGTPFLAGSAANMPSVIACAVRYGGVSLIEAVAMASTRPRMLLPGWSGRWGCYKGDPADMVELEWNESTATIAIRRVTVGGFAVQIV